MNNHPKFDKTNIRWTHDKLTTALQLWCKENGLEYAGSNLKYTAESFDCRFSVKIPGGLSIKQQRDRLGSGVDKNGQTLLAKDMVRGNDGIVYTVVGFKRVKTIIADALGKEFLAKSDFLEKQ